MVKIKLSEPINPRYVYIDPTTNTVHLLVPITSGVGIGLDNTCKTVLALQEFFGKRADSAAREHSARHELIRYKKALEDDIAVLEDSGDKRAKQDRLAQIDTYITLLARIEVHPSLNGLSGGYPTYPRAVKTLLTAPQSNIYGMRLRPTTQDPVLNVENPVFTMNRAKTSDSFYHALFAVYPTITKVTSNTQEDKLKNEVVHLIPEQTWPVKVSAILPTVVAVLSTTYKRMFGKDIDFSINSDTLELLGYEPQEDITDAQALGLLVGGIINAKKTDNFFPPESHFNTVTIPINTEKLSIMTQFLLAEINFYARAQGMTITDFGQVVDNTPPLARALAAVVKSAIEKGLNVETAVCEFINTNGRNFGINRALSETDRVQITQNFTQHFATIATSDHFDEFMILEPNKKGGFFTHQGSLCFDFSTLMQTADFRSFTPASTLARARDGISSIPTVVPGRVSGSEGTIEVDEEVLKAAIIAGVTSNDYTEVRRHLLSTLEDSRKVFEWLGRAFFAQFDTNRQAQELFIQVRRAIPDAAISNSYNRIVRGQEAQLLLTPELARALYVAAVSQIGIPEEMTHQHTTLSSINALLTHIGIPHNVTVTAGYNGNFVIDTTRANITTLQNLITPYTRAFHLTPAMAKSIYKQVNERYGENSPQYLAMMALDNRTLPPQKILKALALLDILIPPSNCSYPAAGRGTNGYVIQHLEEDHLRQIQEIHELQANRFKLTPEIAHALYLQVQRIAPNWYERVSLLSNEERPDKLEAVLTLLRLEYTRIEFNDRNGYYVYLSEQDQARIKSIAGMPLTAEERRLTAGYRPVVVIPDEKSHRGFLFNQIMQRARRATPSRPQPSNPTGVQILAVNAFRPGPIPAGINPVAVQLSCPASILRSFQDLLRGSRVLGTHFHNPYTQRLEQFPTDANELTARHLQILARNEAVNTTGIMRVRLYQGLLDDNQIAAIRSLVKATTIGGIVYATHTGGYPAGSERIAFPTPQKTILIDQAGFQWQGDLRNTGGLFFYPFSPTHFNLPERYTEWQNMTYQAMYGTPRPTVPRGNMLAVEWGGGFLVNLI